MGIYFYQLWNVNAKPWKILFDKYGKYGTVNFLIEWQVDRQTNEY